MTQPDFDRIIERRGTHSAKWDMMERSYGVSAEDGLAMWVADMDFRAPDCVSAALRRMADHGVYGYYGDEAGYRRAICWWMRERHGWEVAPEWIFSTHGLVNGTALCVQTWSAPGDAVLLFTPVYHAFARVIRAAGRQVTEAPLALRDGRYEMDFEVAAAALTGREKMVILCSPHNPGGRVWSVDELRALADFCAAHDLLLVSDEIHHDLVYPGHSHRVMADAVPEASGRLVMMTAPSKTFNIAGSHTGNVIIPDDRLRADFAATLAGLGLSPNSFGLHMTEAAYSPEGAEWVEALIAYLDGNRRLFDAGLGAIPGVRPMALESTYLAWVDFSGTGMTPEEVAARVEKGARIAANHGASFGSGGDSFMRFNLGMARARIEAAVARLQEAFADLQ